MIGKMRWALNMGRERGKTEAEPEVEMGEERPQEKHTRDYQKHC